MASAVVHCEALGLLMFIHCLLLIPLFNGVGPGFINHPAGEERAGCFGFCILNVVSFLYLFLTVPWIGLWCVNMAFPGHTHLLPDQYFDLYPC